MSEKLNHIRLKWPGGVHTFRLEAPEPPRSAPWSPLGTHEAIQATVLRRNLQTYLHKPAHAVAPLHDHAAAVLKRLVTGQFGHADVLETIRCGLIGGGDLEGGAADDEWESAAELVRVHVASEPLFVGAPIAQTILFAAIYGVPPDYADLAEGVSPASIPAEAFIAEVPLNG